MQYKQTNAREALRPDPSSPREVIKHILSFLTHEPQHDKTNKMTSVRPAKTRISLGIRPVWSESSLCAQWVAKDLMFLHVDSKDSDQTGRMPRLIWVRWAHMPYCWFCREAAHITNCLHIIICITFCKIFCPGQNMQQTFLKFVEIHFCLCQKYKIGFWIISVFESTAYLKFAKLQYVSSGFRCRVIAGSLMRLY